MKQHTFLQGSAEWHAHRALSKNASDAPAALGCSPYTTRQQLLHTLHTGLRPEASSDQERIYAAGHAIEAAQRPGAEEFIGDELFPVVGSEEIEGILLSASFDGITMTGETLYECKTLNADLRAAFADMGTIAPDKRERAAGKCLPKHFRVQMEQQLAVSGAERVLFVAATKDGSDVRRCWYYPDLKLRAEIIAGWKQLEADLASYVPPSSAGIEKIAAEPVEALPAPMVQVTGQLTLQDNFKVFEERLRHFLEHRLIREPKTDQDFADLDLQIKAMKQAREALKAAEAQMLAQVQPVDQAKKTKDMLDKLLQQNCSMAEALLKDEKERRRGEIVALGVGALKAHINGLNARLGKAYMPAIPADFGGCIKGKSALAKMEDAVATELARAKIAANEVADRIDANLKALRELAADYSFLFPDTRDVVTTEPAHCRLMIESRIANHKAAEERRLEAERVRIRAEEQARAEEKIRQEQEAAAQRQREAAAALAQQQPAPSTGADVVPYSAHDRINDEGARRLHAELAAGNVHPMPTKASAQPAPRTLNLTTISARLGVTLPAAFVRDVLKVKGEQDRNATKFSEPEFDQICVALLEHVSGVRMQFLQQRAA